MADELRQIREFFGRYRDLNETQVSSFFTRFDAFKVAFGEFEKAAKIEAQQLAPGFNVFSILGLDRYEEHTHSAMLAHLLRPNSSHGQMQLFLKKFFLIFAEKYSDFPTSEDEMEEGDWIVRTEVVFGNGRMDIVIQSPDLNCLYVIENKIDAFEQVDQLVRYTEWMKTQEEEYPTQALLFLTISGYQSATSAGVRYFPISYHQDISA